MRPIDADELIKNIPNEEMISKYAVAHAPTIDKFEIAKEALIEAADNAETVGDVVENIINRPQEWIPCSERLPKKERATYLICTESGYMCSCRWTNDMYGLGSHEWSEWGWHIMDKPQYAKVVAWMEMEPWKGADDDLL